MYICKVALQLYTYRYYAHTCVDFALMQFKIAIRYRFRLSE